jgi:hypothetical protein
MKRKHTEAKDSSEHESKIDSVGNVVNANASALSALSASSMSNTTNTANITGATGVANATNTTGTANATNMTNTTNIPQPPTQIADAQKPKTKKLDVVQMELDVSTQLRELWLGYLVEIGNLFKVEPAVSNTQYKGEFLGVAKIATALKTIYSLVRKKDASASADVLCAIREIESTVISGDTSDLVRATWNVLLHMLRAYFPKETFWISQFDFRLRANVSSHK